MQSREKHSLVPGHMKELPVETCKHGRETAPRAGRTKRPPGEGGMVCGPGRTLIGRGRGVRGGMKEALQEVEYLSFHNCWLHSCGRICPPFNINIGNQLGSDLPCKHPLSRYPVPHAGRAAGDAMGRPHYVAVNHCPAGPHETELSGVRVIHQWSMQEHQPILSGSLATPKDEPPLLCWSPSPQLQLWALSLWSFQGLLHTVSHTP